MNEMIYMPLMWGIILGTALLSAIVTTALPYVPKWWNALKSRIKRKPTPKSNATDIVDVILIAKLTERVDDLQEQVDNLIEVKYNRDRNRKNNIRRDVRDYLKELQK
jgi:hypothetical protein